jgi:hypothetical protein
VAEQFPEALVRLACVRYRCAWKCAAGSRTCLLWAAACRGSETPRHPVSTAFEHKHQPGPFSLAHVGLL